MRKNNSALVLFVFIMLVSTVLGVVFADNEEYDENDYESFSSEEKDLYQKVLIEPEYTTLYENDEMNIEIGFNDIFPLEKTPFYIEFDKNVFELDLTNIKTSYGYKYLKHDVKENSDTIKYIFYYDVSKEANYDFVSDYIECLLFDTEFANGRAVDDVVFYDIKLKIKSSVKLGVHEIYSGYVDSDEKNSLPVTIIKNENTSNTLSNFVYSSCNSKCKALNAGKNVSVCSSDMWGCLNDEKIIFSDGTVVAYNTSCIYDGYFLDFDYNTVYQGDNVNVKVISKNNIDLYKLIYDEEKQEYLKYDNGGYKLNPIIISFNKNAFDVDIKNIEFFKENYKLNNYKVIEEGDSIAYLLYFEYNGDLKINFPFEKESEFFKWNVKIKENTTLGTYYIKLVDYYFDENNMMSDIDIDISGKLEERVDFWHFYPINIIDNKLESSYEIKNVYLYPGSFGLNGDVVSVNDDYSYIHSFDINYIEYINVICNQRCYVKNNGGTSLDISDSFDVKIIYSNNFEKKYTFTNLIKNHAKLQPLLHSWFEIIVIGNGTQKNYQHYFDKINDYIKERKDSLKQYATYFDSTYYNYEEFTEAEKIILDRNGLNIDDVDLPLIIVLEDFDEPTNYISGQFSDEELYKYICNATGIGYKEKINDSEDIIENNKNDVNSDDNAEYVFEYQTKRYYKIIKLTIFLIICIFVFIIFFIVLLGKYKKNKVKLDTYNKGDVLNEK